VDANTDTNLNLMKDVGEGEEAKKRKPKKQKPETKSINQLTIFLWCGFCDEDRHEPFTSSWWTWLTLRALPRRRGQLQMGRPHHHRHSWLQHPRAAVEPSPASSTDMELSTPRSLLPENYLAIESDLFHEKAGDFATFVPRVNMLRMLGTREV